MMSRLATAASSGEIRRSNELPQISSRSKPMIWPAEPLTAVTRPPRSVENMTSGLFSKSERYLASLSRSRSEASLLELMSRKAMMMPKALPSRR
jgi:hypothetical protein